MAFGQCGTHVLNITDNCSLYSSVTARNASSSSAYQPSVPTTGAIRGFDFQKVVELYVTGLLIVPGIFGNVTSIAVLRRDRERRAALFLLQALALADCLYLSVAVFRYPLKYLLPSHERFISIQPIVFPLLKTFQTITIWMIVAVTIDRYTCVCRPLTRGPRLFSQRKRQGCAAALFAVGFLYNVPRFLDSCVYRWYNPCTGAVVSRMSYRESFVNSYYYNVYLNFAYLALLYVVPLSTLAYMNCRLVQAIRNSHAQRYHENWIAAVGAVVEGRRAAPNSHSPPGALPGAQSDKNATTVLVIVVIAFIVCETPELVLKFVTFTERNSSYSGLLLSHDLLRFNVVSQLLMVINSSINFPIYLIFGRRFRRILRETFRVSFAFGGSRSTSSSCDGTAAAAAAVMKLHHNCIHTRK